MAELANEVGDRFRRKPRIRVQRHDEFDVFRQTLVRREIARILIATQQQIQLMELATLALPAHPAALLFIEQAATVKQEEARLFAAGIMLIELGYFIARIFVDFHIRRRDFLLCIHPVADQREIDFAAWIGEIMDLKIADLLVDGIARIDKRWHGNKRARLNWQAFLIFEADQARRLHKPRHQRIEQRIRRVHCRENREQREQSTQVGRKPGPAHAVIDRQQNQNRENGCWDEETQQAQITIKAQGFDAEWRLVAAHLFKLRASLARKIIGDRALTFRAVDICWSRGLAVFCKFECCPGDVNFAHIRKASELFNRHAIGIARTEIQKFKIAMVAQNCIDLVDGFKPGFPVDIVNSFEAGDDIAHRHTAGGLAGMFFNDGVFGIAAFLLENTLKPACGSRCIGRGAAQAIKQMRGKCAVTCCLRILRQNRVELILISGNDDAISSSIGEIAHVARAINAQRQTTRILDEEIPHSRWQRPEFTNLQRLDSLKALNKRRQRLEREITVGVSNIKPCKRKNTRHVLIFFNAGLIGRQLADELPRQIAACLLDGLVDLIMIVEQPLCGWRNRLASARSRIGRAVCVQDQLAIFRQALIELKSLIAGQIQLFATCNGGREFAQLILAFVKSTYRRGLLGRNLIRSLAIGNGRIRRRRRQFRHVP
ncbi:hypothetical protein D3C80_405140 [compost metagenome]